MSPDVIHKSINLNIHPVHTSKSDFGFDGLNSID